MKLFKFFLFLLAVIALTSCLPKPNVLESVIERPKHTVYLPLIEYSRSGKKCVGSSETFNMEHVKNLGSNCIYRYWPYGEVQDNVEILGMVNTWSPITVTGNMPYFLGYNEPELNGLTPEWVAEVWPSIVEANSSSKSVSPAPLRNPGAWLSDFREEHIKLWGYPPKLDVLALHCYESYLQCRAKAEQVIRYAKEWGIKEVWITEFAFSDQWQGKYPPESSWEIEAQKLINWMNSETMITRYYWWALEYDPSNENQPWSYRWPTSLYVWGTDELTEAGKFYREQP
jgi:hypothetical protein